MVSKTMYSSASVEWATPQDLFDRLNAQYQFTLDVCATPENAKCARYFTSELNALLQGWGEERVWCNPPYGREISHWVQRCANARGHTGGVASWVEPKWIPDLAVMLLPARTDTRWWHDYVIPYGRVEFVRGRLKFGGSKNSAPFPSAIVVFGDVP